MTRDEMISWLVEDDMNHIDGGYARDWLAVILVDGFEGYGNVPDVELRREILERDPEALND